MAFSLSKTHLVLHVTLVLTIFQTHDFRFSYSSKPSGFSLKLIPRDSPESPLYPGNLTQTQRVERLIKFSNARANYLKYSAALTKPENIQLGLFRDAFHFIVPLVLAVPWDTQYVVMDTGSSLLWMQCEPCIRCYKQTTSIYDSLASLSYWKLPCSHFLCNNGPQARFQCVNDECIYTKSYADGSGPTNGIASVETFRFPLNDNTIQPLDGIVFGCSNDNANNFGYEDTPIAGILGLSLSPESLVTQLPDYVQGRFSYCLRSFDQDAEEPSFLTFGSAIPTLLGNLQTTAFVRSPISGNYYFYLNLLDISVGWDRLGFPSDTFKLNQDGSGGICIDSGSVSSFMNNEDLPNGRNPYKEVIGAFQKYYDSLSLNRRNDVPHFDLCYAMPQGFKQFATMTYHFDKADYTVDGRYANYISVEGGYFCVALLGTVSGVSILGAWHQQNKRIIYNANIFALQFSDELCG
ncbi:Aspartic proteinase nepenthesin-2 [Morus notabilis]|uniref:Aspartic proteinase nepenthesin-2 n=1 Tax=Morus notabilis TaxID=981085 RepID=W9R0B5_9ROSA|nr:Aspartic proteinase nepenthesin-2 [Morus notabilis]